MNEAKRQATVREIRRRIRALRRELQEGLASGVSSASISGAGNSQSYSRIDPDKLRAEIARLERELRAATTMTPYRRTCADFDL